MLKHVGIVMTGRVEYAPLCELQERFPFVEFGVQMTKSKWTESATDWLKRTRNKGLCLVAHISGPAWIQEIFEGKFQERLDVYDWELFQRIQVNIGKAPRMRRKTYYPELIEKLGVDTIAENLKGLPPEIEMIFQIRRDFFPCYLELGRAIQATGRSVSYLFDARSKSSFDPSSWSVPPDGFSAGYAGQINVESIHEALPAAAQLAQEFDGWIDLQRGALDESGVFDLERVEKILEASAPWMEGYTS